MKDKDKQEFRAILAGLAEIYTPTRPMSLVAQRLYFQALSDLSLAQVRSAATTALSESGRTFMPRPGELRKLAVGDRAEMAWLEVMKAVRHVGDYGSPKWTDPVIAHAVNATGGWARLCESSDDDFHIWIRKRFIEEYDRLAVSKDQLTNMHLPGIHECNGSPVRPKLIRCEYCKSILGIEHQREPLAVVKKLTKEFSNDD